MQQSCSDYSDTCSSVIYQTVDVGLPITLIPSIDMGKIKIKCYGEPRIELCKSGCNHERLEIRITQTVTYKIPIEYSIESNIGDVTSECKKDSANCHC